MSFKLFYYIKRFTYNGLPDFFFARNVKRLKEYERNCDAEELASRLAYYVKTVAPFELPHTAQKIGEFKRTKGTDYYLDLKDFLNHFPKDFIFLYHFGDDTSIKALPTLIKARSLGVSNENSILFKLNKKRHFHWVNDLKSFGEKQDKLVWRGGAYKRLRRGFVERFYNHPQCDVGQTNSPEEQVPWQKPFMSIENQLDYKFIFCPEGNDVATNLKWVMSSNSIAIMAKPKIESWFMEKKLIADYHYILIKDDYSDLEEKLMYYINNLDECIKIINNANTYVNQFNDSKREKLISLLVLEKYFIKTLQIPKRINLLY